MKIASMILSGVVGVGSMFSTGCREHRPKVVVVEDRPVVYSTPRPVYVEERRPSEMIVVRQPPPPVIVERVPPPPADGYVWVSGYYNWSGARYVWVPGHYNRPPRPGSCWVPDRWSPHSRGGYRYEPGHWR